MVLDCFNFNDELDLLEIRFNILGPYVDKFVLIESPLTFTGNPKPLYYAENKERYAKWNHKIIHCVAEPGDKALEQKALLSPNTGAGESWWLREFYQKEYLSKVPVDDEDIVFVSDVDEIWNPLIPFKYLDYSRVYRPHQIAYHYYLNNRSNQDIGGWVGTRVGKAKVLKEHGANHFRTEKFVPSVMLENGGWHFTNLGSLLVSKLESYSHQEYNTDQVKNSIETSIKNNIDFLGRGFRLWVDETGLPEYLLQNKDKWKHLWKEN